jgi:hypothetical protein
MIEVLKQALEALDEITDDVDGTGLNTTMSFDKSLEAITSLRQAIAELESQEPVAYLCENAVGHKYFRWKKPTSIYKPIALYTRPLQHTWVGLTDEDDIDWEEGGNLKDLVKAIEAKLKERNG